MADTHWLTLRIFRIAPLLIATLFTTSCVSVVRPNFTEKLVELRAGQYSLDSKHSYLLFRIDHLGLSKVIGRFNKISATLDFDPAKPESLTLQGIIESDSIDLNDSDLESTLKEPSWLDSTSYPQITFESTQTTLLESGQLQINGILNMRGVNKPLSLLANFNGGADNLITGKYTIGFSATSTLNREDFGMDKFQGIVGKTLDVELHGEFLRQ